MATLSENIKRFRKQSGLTQKELAFKLGIVPTSISAWEVGRNKPLMDNIEMMAQIFNVKKSDLLGDDLEIIKQTLTSPLPDSVSKLNQKLNQKNRTKWVDYGNELLEEQNQVFEEELYEYQVYEKLSAGTGSSYFNDGNFDTVYFDEDLDHDFASWIYGDSMEPRFLNGEVALIKDTGFDYDGAIYAVEWDGQTYIKKVKREKEGLRLISLNPKYKDKIAPYDEDPRIIGKIVGSFQPISI